MVDEKLTLTFKEARDRVYDSEKRALNDCNGEINILEELYTQFKNHYDTILQFQLTDEPNNPTTFNMNMSNPAPKKMSMKGLNFLQSHATNLINLRKMISELKLKKMDISSTSLNMLMKAYKELTEKVDLEKEAVDRVMADVLDALDNRNTVQQSVFLETPENDTVIDDEPFSDEPTVLIHKQPVKNNTMIDNRSKSILFFLTVDMERIAYTIADGTVEFLDDIETMSIIENVPIQELPDGTFIRLDTNVTVKVLNDDEIE